MKTKRPTNPIHELLKYLAAGVLIAGLWAAFGGIAWQLPGERMTKSEAALEKAVLRSEISTLRSKIESQQNSGANALAVEDLRKAETKLAELDE